MRAASIERVRRNRRTTMRRKLPKHEVGSGNLFADVGLPDAELHLLKAEIVNRIDDILRERGPPQAAARIMGISKPDVSKILRGLFRGFSLERLLVLLAALGRDVTIDVRGRRSGNRALCARYRSGPPADECPTS